MQELQSECNSLALKLTLNAPDGEAELKPQFKKEKRSLRLNWHKQVVENTFSFFLHVFTASMLTAILHLFGGGSSLLLWDQRSAAR